MRTILPTEYRLVPENAKCVFTGTIFRVYQWEQELFDGTTTTFEMLKRPDTLQVLAIKDGQLVVLLEQQPSFGKATYGLPGGRHDVESETELQAAQRELLEETGMTFKNWRLIRVDQPHSKIEWFVYLYVATEFLRQTDQHLDAGEKIEIKSMDFEGALELAKSGTAHFLPTEILEHAGSIAALADLPPYGSGPVPAHATL